MANTLQTSFSRPEQMVLSQGTFLEPSTPRYRATFLFVAFYFLVAHGRIHLIVPFLLSIPCAMIAGVMAVIAFFVESGQYRERFYLIREEKLVLGLVIMCFVT